MSTSSNVTESRRQLRLMWGYRSTVAGMDAYAFQHGCRPVASNHMSPRQFTEGPAGQKWRRNNSASPSAKSKLMGFLGPANGSWTSDTRLIEDKNWQIKIRYICTTKQILLEWGFPNQWGSKPFLNHHFLTLGFFKKKTRVRKLCFGTPKVWNPHSRESSLTAHTHTRPNPSRDLKRSVLQWGHCHIRNACAKLSRIAPWLYTNQVEQSYEPLDPGCTHSR